MGEVTEFKWIVNLLDSELIEIGIVKSIISKNKPGCKKDFERAAHAPCNNIEFANWFNNMVQKQVFRFVEEKETTGKVVKTYLINEPELWNELKSIPLYESVRTAFKKKSRFIET